MFCYGLQAFLQINLILSYDIARTDKERYINSGNPSMSLANLSNVDVQYIGQIGSKLTDCMTKGEKLEIDETWEEVNYAYKGLGPWATSFL